MIFLISLAFIVIAAIEIPGLIVKKMWGELATVCILIAIGYIMALIPVMNIDVPTPNDAIIFLITEIINLVS